MELLQCWDPLAWHAVIFIVQISANTYVYVCVHMSVTFFLGVIWLEKGVRLGKGRQLFAGLLDHVDWVDFFWLARYHQLPSLRHEHKG